MTLEEFNSLQKELLGKNVSVYLIGGDELNGLWITNQVHTATTSVRIVLKTEKGNITIPLKQVKLITEQS